MYLDVKAIKSGKGPGFVLYRDKQVRVYTYTANWFVLMF